MNSPSSGQHTAHYSPVIIATFVDQFIALARWRPCAYRRARQSLRTSISPQSRHALDWTNFFLADVQTGFGAFVAFYLADLGWTKGQVGLPLTAGTLAAVPDSGRGAGRCTAMETSPRRERHRHDLPLRAHPC
jgi:hypothetical protein